MVTQNAPTSTPNSPTESEAPIAPVAYRHLFITHRQSETPDAPTTVFYEIKDEGLREVLRPTWPYQEGWKKTPRGIAAHLVWPHLDEIEGMAADESEQTEEAVKTFVKVARRDFSDETAKIKDAKLDGYLPHNLLWSEFAIGNDVQVKDEHGADVAFRVTSWTYLPRRDRPITEVLLLKGYSYQWVGGSDYERVPVEHSIKKYTGSLPLLQLDALRVDSKLRAALQSRADEYVAAVEQQVADGQIAYGAKEGFYPRCVDELVLGCTEPFGDNVRAPRGGFAVLDPAGFAAAQPEEDEDKPQAAPAGKVPLPDDATHLLPARIPGYSLTARCWAEFPVAGLTDVDYPLRPLQELAVSKRQCEVMEALVNKQKRDQGSLVVGLVGRSGTGKTRMAVATAHTRKMPLYAISAADLGATAQELRTAIKTVLARVRKWNAVLLIDDIDHVLCRDRGMRRDRVPVESARRAEALLQLLEMHTGIVLLSSSFNEGIDAPLAARLTVALHLAYPDEYMRCTLWRNAIKKVLPAGGAGKRSLLPTVDAEHFARRPMTAREIEQALAAAVAVGEEENVKVDTELVQKVVSALGEVDPRQR